MAYHELLDGTTIEFPEGFLKKWMTDTGRRKKDQMKKLRKNFPLLTIN